MAHKLKRLDCMLAGILRTPRFVVCGDSTSSVLGWRDMGDGTEALIEARAEYRYDGKGGQSARHSEAIVMRRPASDAGEQA